MHSVNIRGQIDRGKNCNAACMRTNKHVCVSTCVLARACTTSTTDTMVGYNGIKRFASVRMIGEMMDSEFSDEL